MLRISRFVHFLHGGQILWNALTFSMIKNANGLGKMIDINNHDPKPDSFWQEMLGGKLPQMLSGGFLVTDQQEDNLLQKATEEASSRSIQNLYLIMTNRCNLACSYCLYGTKNSQTLDLENQAMYMSEQVAGNAIECFAEITKSNPHTDGYWQQITFYGGEPLLNVDALEASVDAVLRLKRNGLLWDDTNLVINTNGVLINDQSIDLIKRGNIEVQISIDGFADVHDKNRYMLTRDGSTGSFDYVVNALQRLTCAGISVTPMITVTEDNLGTLDQFVVWLCKEFSIKSYGMSILMSGTGKTAEDYPERAAEMMYKTYLAASGYGAYDYALQDQLEGLFGPRIAKQECGAGRKLTVFPDGMLHTCQALEATGLTSVGKLPVFEQAESNWQNWSQRSRFQNPACLECPVLGACGGGCAAGSFHSSGDINQIDPNKCNWTKSLFNLRLSTCT
ncbi:MAG: radical SAM protein [Patescibacteria group bacterium]